MAAPFSLYYALFIKARVDGNIFRFLAQVKILNPVQACLPTAGMDHLVRDQRSVQRLGYLTAMDTVVVYWDNTKHYILTAIGTVSKIAFARMYTAKSSRSVTDLWWASFFDNLKEQRICRQD